jgi:hypothetical protein
MRFIVSHHPPASFFWAALLNSLFIICCPLVKIEASRPSEHSKSLLRMLDNTILGNGRQNQKQQVLNTVWRYGKEYAQYDNE